MPAADPTPRTASPTRRDPARKERILTAAAELAARRGFHTVAMTEIGADAGIVGSGIYRHFPTKESILVALLDRVMQQLQDGAGTVVAAGHGPRPTLSMLVGVHVRAAIEDRSVLAVYHREAHTLPEEDRHRLRRAQRLYLEEWVHTLAPLRPDLTDAELRQAVHGAVGAIHSTLFFRSGLNAERLAVMLTEMAHASLGVTATTTVVNGQ